MKRFKNILLLLDPYFPGHTELLQTGFNLAKSNQAKITVASVVESLPDFRMALAKRLLQILDRTAAKMNHEGVKTETKVFVGIPFLQIIRDVLRNNRDLVMIQAEGADGKGIIFGSTTLHLLRKCPATLWVMKSGQHVPARRIVAAVDPEPDNSVKQALNRKILELADSLRQRENADFHIVHAWSIPGERFLLAGVDWIPDSFQLEKVAQDMEQKHTSQLAELLQSQGLDSAEINVHVMKGAAADIVCDTSEKIQAGLIVMGTVNRTIAGFLIGSTAEKVLQRINCSVLAVKPEGFVTPVQLEESDERDF